MSSTDPQMTDGLSAILDPLVQCLNLAGDGTTYQRYGYLSDNLDTDANEKDHSNADGAPLGGQSGEGHEKGSISVQKDQASYKWPRPGHVLQFDCGEPAGIYASTSRYYRTGKAGNARTRNEVSKASLSCSRIYNPIITNLLTEEFGQKKVVTQAAGAWSALTGAMNVVNTRTGGTLAFALQAAPGNTVPAWLSCSATTGALTGTAVATAATEVYIVVTETVTGQETRKGFGILNFTVT